MFQVMILAHRKAGISHQTFHDRYERHMEMVKGFCGDAPPILHMRWLPYHSAGPDGEATLLAGTKAQAVPSVVGVMTFADTAAWERFHIALSTEEARKAIAEDEAGFWDRNSMQAVEVDGFKICGFLMGGR